MLHSSNADIDIGGIHIAGQTFRVPQTQVLQWIDLELDFPFFASKPTLEVTWADNNHKPWGPVFSRDRYIIGNTDVPGAARRIRFSMQPATLYPDEYYCVIVYYWPVFLGGPLRWFYNAGGNKYPFGVRLSSDDRGVTWDVHHSDDHLFYVFGKPPTLDPEPSPPIPNFFLLDIKYMCTADGYRIQTITNVPTHLYLVWTDIEPEKHKHPLYRRGSSFSESIQFCFTQWISIEQEEEGDTIYHTFIAEPWLVCQTRWQTFIGQIQNTWSPSVGPIFKKHKSEPITLVIPANPDARTLYSTFVQWPLAHDAPSAPIRWGWDAPQFQLRAGSWQTVSFFIFRNFLLFDTSLIPRHVCVCNIALHLYILEANINWMREPNIYITPGHQSSPVIPSNFGEQLTVFDPLGIIDIRDFIVDQYNTIPLDFLAFDHLNRYYSTKYCLRSELDIVDHAPIRVYQTNILFHSVQAGGSVAPELIVKYELE